MSDTVLLVDDDPVFVAAVAAVLRTRFDVLTAGDGEEALMAMATQRPDLIILDVMMSYQSEGYDLASTLKKNPDTARIPIIILTGVDKMFEIRSRMEGTWVDVESFMTKPPNFAELLETIHHLIDTSRVAAPTH
jgi:CheY-like chemotaxis protein